MMRSLLATARFLGDLVADLGTTLGRRWHVFVRRTVLGEGLATIAIDVGPALERTTGVGWYEWNLLGALDRQEDGLLYNLYPASFLGPGDASPELPAGLRCHHRLHRAPADLLLPLGPTLALLRRFLGPLLTILDRNDVLFVPDLTAPDDDPPVAAPVVATAHDLGFAAMPESLLPEEQRELRRALAARLFRIARVVAVSDATAEDLGELLGVSRERVHTVHEGIEERFAPAPRPGEPEVDLPARYLLVVSTLEPRKNLVNLLRAFALVVEWGYPGVLLLVGEWRGRYRPIEREIERSPVGDRIVRRTDVTREMLPAIYRGADALLLPSWLEGFGLPLIEAMACGTPVVTSGRSAMPEVAGPAAIYVDPASPHGIASGISALLADPQHGERLAGLGRERAARFSWERAAAATAEVLRLATGLEPTGDDEYRV